MAAEYGTWPVFPESPMIDPMAMIDPVLPRRISRVARLDVTNRSRQIDVDRRRQQVFGNHAERSVSERTSIGDEHVKAAIRREHLFVDSGDRLRITCVGDAGHGRYARVLELEPAALESIIVDPSDEHHGRAPTTEQPRRCPADSVDRPGDDRDLVRERARVHSISAA
ncbi:MAG: hypothetical protein R2697_08095 [Ilumatobacteraceae bacterium]